MSKKDYEIGSRNVFKDLGVPNAEEQFSQGATGIQDRRNYKKASHETNRGRRSVGVRQPDISKMLRGEFRQFSVERLLRFLVRLDQDVEIVVRPHRDTGNAPALHVS